MEFLFELIFEIVFEGSLELGTSKKVRKPVRILALILFLLIYAAIIVVISLFGISMMRDEKVAFGVIVIVFNVFLLMNGVWAVVKRYKEQNQKSDT